MKLGKPGLGDEDSVVVWGCKVADVLDRAIVPAQGLVQLDPVPSEILIILASNELLAFGYMVFIGLFSTDRGKN